MKKLKHREVNWVPSVSKCTDLMDSTGYAEAGLLPHCGKKRENVGLSAGVYPYRRPFSSFQRMRKAHLCCKKWAPTHIVSETVSHRLMCMTWTYRHKTAGINILIKCYRYRLEGCTPNLLGNKLQESRDLWRSCAAVSPTPITGCRP